MIYAKNQTTIIINLKKKKKNKRNFKTKAHQAEPLMDFDPLSLYTPSPSQNEEVVIPKCQDIYESKESRNLSETAEDDSHLEPIHILDLPLLQLKPPYEVLISILKLLSPEETLNFGGSLEHSNNIAVNQETIFQEKDITELDIKAMTWLQLYCPRFDTIEKLAHLPSLSSSLKLSFAAEYNAYMTNLISNPLSWITNQKHIDTLQKLACLRLSENCGRTAQPEIIRRIVLPNLDQWMKTKTGHLKLREPSLTNHNLGLKTWGSALILSQRLLTHDYKKYLYKSVLELGSGTGLVGMVSSLLGYHTVLTDLPEIVPNLQLNVDLNKLINATVLELDWTNPQSFLKSFPDTKFQTILVSDPVYSSKHPYLVVDMINLFFDDSDPKAKVLVQIPLRPKFENERQVLWDLMKANLYLEIEHEIEEGFDDFGEMKFCFKVFKKKK